MRKISLIFPGQGSQYIGMGTRLYNEYPEARQVFAEANDVLGFDLKKMCFTGDMPVLSRTENAQPAILAVSTAAFRVYMKRFNLRPGYAAGHSLGEISALTCAGAVTFADALHIARSRGIFMQETFPGNKGAMAALSEIEPGIVEEYCRTRSDSRQLVVISNYNAPSQTVISGHKAAVLLAGEELEKKGARMKILNTNVPFHCPLMEPAALKLKEELKKYKYNPLEFKVLSNVTALPYESEEDIVENLFTQVTAPVQWTRSMDYLEQRGIDTMLELGPNTVLKNIMKKNTTGISAYSFDVEEDIQELAQALSGNFIHLIDRTLAAAVACPNRNWDNDEYREGVIVPFRKIKQMSIDLESEGKFPTEDQVREAMAMLKSVLQTKKLPPLEQEERIREIVKETQTISLFMPS